MLIDPQDAASTDIVDAALSRIKTRISERRAAGDYPLGLEDELDRHYRQVSDTLHGTSASLRRANDAVRQVGLAGGFASERISYESRIPAGNAVHRAVGRATIRQTHGVLQQMQEFSAATRLALEACLDVMRESAIHTHPQVERRLAYLIDKVGSMESVRDAVVSLEARVAELEARLSTATD